MANILTSNPIQIDTAGATSIITTPVTINSIVVIASGDVWSIIIKDASGTNVIFRADSSLTNHRSVYWSPSKPHHSQKGLNATTLTSIALVLIYV